jgi:para-nitrobenzyl esterase
MINNSIRILSILMLSLTGFACQPAAVEPTPSAMSEPPASTVTGPIAATQYGPVRGTEENGIQIFKGVRYGADTATTRFAAPKAPGPWTEPADALEFGNTAPQPERSLSIGLFDSWQPDPVPGMGEDCLFLNVWTPGLADGGKRPVLVWLHGGGFTSGSGSSNAYDGARLAARGDAVIVTVNHRLNVFGYLYLDQYGEQFAGSANAGIMDLVASLEWVRDNIEAFGGDPDNVLIFGESGGGWKVSTLMAMDAAKGLFHKAVAQSGPGLEMLTPDQVQPASEALLAELGLTEENIDQIRTVPAEEISAAALRVAATGLRIGTRPVVDGVHLSRHPFSPDAPAQSMDIPLLIGSTQTEMSLLAGAGNPDLFELTWETLPTALSVSIPGIDADEVIEGYRQLHPEVDAANLYFEATTDNSIFGRGSFDLADRKATKGGAPVFQYFLAWKTPVDGGKWGVPHALDIGFVFDNVAYSESMSGTGEEQQAIADMMSEAWLAFARTGNPNHDGLPDWAPYNADERATMVFNTTPALVNDPRGAERQILDAAL